MVFVKMICYYPLKFYSKYGIYKNDTLFFLNFIQNMLFIKMICCYMGCFSSYQGKVCELRIMSNPSFEWLCAQYCHLKICSVLILQASKFGDCLECIVLRISKHEEGEGDHPFYQGGHGGCGYCRGIHNWDWPILQGFYAFSWRRR